MNLSRFAAHSNVLANRSDWLLLGDFRDSCLSTFSDEFEMASYVGVRICLPEIC